MSSYTLAEHHREAPGSRSEDVGVCRLRRRSRVVVLDRRADQPAFDQRGKGRTFECDNKRAFRRYRLTFHQNQGGAHFQLAEIALGNVALAPAVGATSGAGTGSATNYRRELDLATGIHRVSYEQGGMKIRARERSRAIPAGVHRRAAHCQQAGSRSPRSVQLKGAHQETTRARRAATCCFDGKFDNGLEYTAQLRVLHEGGTVRADAASRHAQLRALRHRHAAARRRHQLRHGLRRAVTWASIRAPACSPSSTAAAKTPLRRPAPRARRRPRPRSLGPRRPRPRQPRSPDVRALPTDERLAAYGKGGDDPELEALLFQYGRYLLASCSRPGGLPANLQGLWNDSNKPPWHSDYHANINIQMNYWLAEPANLAECHTPLFDLIQSQLEPWRKATAGRQGVPDRLGPRRAAGPCAPRTTSTADMGWQWDKTGQRLVLPALLGALRLQRRQGMARRRSPTRSSRKSASSGRTT